MAKKTFLIKNELTRALDDTVTAATLYAGDLHVDILPTNKIELDPENPRILALTLEDMFYGVASDDPLYQQKQKEKESLQSLAQTIKENGLLNPIVVYKHNTNYKLIAGERRVLASILAGNTTVQAKILKERPAPLKLTLLQWIENNERADLTLWERIRNFEKITVEFMRANNLSDLREVRYMDLSHLTGISPPQIMCYVNILQASSALKRTIEENQIRNLDKASLIAKADPTHEKILIKACIEGASLKRLKELEALLKQQEITAKEEIHSRTKAQINFGSTRHFKTAEILVKALAESKRFRHLTAVVENMDWNSPRAISQLFKQIITDIEKDEGHEQ
jgi:ParB family chromosome partitioning protein